MRNWVALMIQDLRKIYEVSERTGRHTVLQVRYIVAFDRNEAKQVYEEQHRLRKDTALAAVVINSDSSAFQSDTEPPAQVFRRVANRNKKDKKGTH
jgi:hypothetical protein